MPVRIFLLVSFLSFCLPAVSSPLRQEAGADSTSPVRPKVGLVLSGGGGRGVSQIGVLRALERHRIPVDLIVGASFGSVVGGLSAAGYTSAEIESIAVATNWGELLSFSEETKRTDLFVGQREAYPVGYLVIRFEGLEPVIPSSISGGQRLSNYFSDLTLQAPYHPDPTFDDLRIPFRAVSTDLISGSRVILDRGSLAEAMRASVTVPLLYSPLERDSLHLVDGGLISNIPVDVARSLGCDIVIAVNTTSSMRTGDQLSAPWEIADQIISIMMQESNRRQIAMADIVISPETGDRIVSDFSGIDSLILAGERAGEDAIASIVSLLAPGGDAWTAPAAEIGAAGTDGPPWKFPGSVVLGTPPPGRHFRGGIGFSGNILLPDSLIRAALEPGDGDLRDIFEGVIGVYRRNGYSLARIDTVLCHGSPPDSISFTIDEGRIGGIRYRGNLLTRDYIIRREFPMDVGDIFRIEDARQGLTNIKSTGLFEYVLLDIRYEDRLPVVVLRVKEKSSELAQFGFRTDDAYGFVGAVTLRDGNFRGAWEDVSVTARYGDRYSLLAGEYVVNRIFNSYLTLRLRGYLASRDVGVYRDDPLSPLGKFDRLEAGKYRETKNGGSLSFGSHFKRFGDVNAELRAEHHRIAALSGEGYTPEEYDFVSLRLQSIADTKNKFLFPTDGIYLALSYESASRRLGGDVGFIKIGVTYESFTTLFRRHTLRPRIVFGFADQTLPVAEQFSLGGLDSFFGLRENDSRGRQLLIVGLEYRYWLPFKLLFESYLRVRYDLGTISNDPTELKFSEFKHGVGAELSLDTPLGEASLGVGKSFYFRHELPDSPVTTGPLVFYFSLGPRF